MQNVKVEEILGGNAEGIENNAEVGQILDESSKNVQADVEVGQILDGKVKGIKKFGAFVELPNRESGLVHISQISSNYVNSVEDYLSEGQDVKVKVLNVEKSESGKKKISLSIRQAEVPVVGKENSYRNNNRDWKGQKNFNNFNKNEKPKSNNFEDMMAKFKKESEEKMSDLSQRLDGF